MEFSVKLDVKRTLQKALPILVPLFIVAVILIYDNSQKTTINSAQQNSQQTPSNSNNYQDYSKYIKKDQSDTNSTSETESTTNSPGQKSISDTSSQTATATDLTIPESQRKDLLQGAWIPDWGLGDGITSLYEQSTQYDSISPVWYEINADGTLKNKRNSRANELQLFATKNRIKIIPSIASFDWETIHSILSNNQYTTTHINAIINETVNNSYAGIDLDYESTQLVDKDAYINFIKELYSALKNKGKTLSITVLAQWGDNVSYNSLKETREVQDWAILSQYADEIRIMGYDYTSPSNPQPGPIGPLYWAESIIRYAVTKIPRDKIWYGVNLYGYEWTMTKPAEEQYDFIADSNAVAFTYDGIKPLLSQETTQSTYDKIAGEGIAKYDCYSTKVCISYFTTKESITNRLELGKKYGIKGLYYWRLGKELDIL